MTTTKQQIAECLISCRNILLGGRTNAHVLPSLERVLIDLDSITVASTKKIVERCVIEAIAQIKSADFMSAGWILSLIHNLPVDDADDKRWDVDYFLSIELSTFLEHFEEVKSARQIVLFICQELAMYHLPNGR